MGDPDTIAATMAANALVRGVFDAVRHGDVSLALAVEWDERGAAAWAATDDRRGMLRLLGFDEHAPDLRPDADVRLGRARFAQLRTCVRREAVGECAIGEDWRTPHGCAPCADAIRREVPTPPTLAELLEGLRDD